MRARIGTAFTVAAGKPRSSITAAIGIETFIVSGLPQASAAASRKQRASATCGAARPRARRPARGSARRAGRAAGGPGGRSPAACAPAVHLARELARDRGGIAARGHLRLRALEQQRALLGRAEDDRTAAEDAGRNRALERARVGGERHPRRDVGGHHPVLGDGHEQEVEEEALVLGRLAAGQQQVEVLGEAEPAHQVAGEIAAAHLDAVRAGLADVADAALAPLRHRSRAYPLDM